MSTKQVLRFAQKALAVSACVAALSPSSQAESMLPAPQLVQGGKMLLVGYEADPSAVRALLPRNLEPLGNMVLMNMYTVPDGARTSGLGAYTLTYLTVLVKGHDGYAVGSKDGLPGRYMTFYWNSSDSMRKFTRAAGFPDDSGGVTALEDAGSKVTTTLTVDGKPFIQASADLSGQWSPPSGGQSNYLAGGNGKSLALFPVPWVCSAMETSNPSVTFSMPAGHPAARLKPTKVLWAARMDCDITYPQPVALKK
jgi:acetoacetate decarboxylase